MELQLRIAIVLPIAWQTKTSHSLARVEDELLAIRQRVDALAPMARPDTVIAETEAGP